MLTLNFKNFRIIKDYQSVETLDDKQPSLLRRLLGSLFLLERQFPKVQLLAITSVAFTSLFVFLMALVGSIT